MKIILAALFFLVINQLHAHGAIIRVTTTRYPGYVCYGGRILTSSGTGFAWEAQRSCFISRKPCASFQASHYGTYFNPRHLRLAYAHCRKGQPFRWGDQN